MPEIFDLIDTQDDDNAGQLAELRLGAEPATVLIFTAEAEDVLLHWESDEAARGYLPCPGEHCPLCFIGAAPVRTALLPVVNYETREVAVLRVPTRKNAGSLAMALVPLLKDPQIHNKIVIIGRKGGRYTVRAQPLSDATDRCANVIESFVVARKEGLSLVSAFPVLTAAEMAEIERIRRKIDAIGGYPPASKPTSSSNAHH